MSEDRSQGITRTHEIAWILPCLVLVFVYNLTPVVGFDIWFYQEVGRQVLSGHLPWSEGFLGTTEVYALGRYADHAWGSSTFYRLVYLIGGLWGLVLVRSLLLALMAFVLFRTCRLFGLEPSWSALLAALGLWSFRSRILLRSVLFTDLGLAVLLYLLTRYEKGRDQKSFPFLSLALLMMAWTNLHHGVTLGGLCLLVWVLSRSLPWSLRAKVLLVGAAACFVRPHGLWLPWFILETMGNTAAIANVLEWGPPSRDQILYHMAPLLVVGLLAVVACRERPRPWGNLALAAVGIAMAFKAQRHIGEFCVVMVPVIASFAAGGHLKRRWLPLAVGGLLTAFWWTWQPPDLSRLGQLDPKYPQGLIEELPADHGQIFNSYEFGNFLLFREKAPFIHGMTSQYQEQLLFDFNDILNRTDRRWELLERFGVEAVMLHHPTEVDSTRMLVEDLFASPQWNLTWWDDSGFLFLKGRGQDLSAVRPWSERPFSDPQAAARQLEQMNEKKPSGLALYLQAQAVLEMGQKESALKLGERALQIHPGFYPAHLMRGSLLYGFGRTEEATRALEKAVSLSPESTRARYNLALAYLQNNRAGKARRQLQEALDSDPNFQPALDLLRRIEGR